jgi:hypothetical protein
MSESGSLRLAQAAPLEIPASVTETMRQAGARDNRFGPCPWQLSAGHVQTLDEFLGYVFTSTVRPEPTSPAVVVSQSRQVETHVKRN